MIFFNHKYKKQILSALINYFVREYFADSQRERNLKKIQSQVRKNKDRQKLTNDRLERKKFQDK